MMKFWQLEHEEYSWNEMCEKGVTKRDRRSAQHRRHADTGIELGTKVGVTQYQLTYNDVLGANFLQLFKTNC